MSESDRVFTVYYYWDQPRTGVADFKGEPHAFECVFDDRLDNWSWFHLLKPIDSAVLQLVMEQSQIFSRWEDAYRRRQATLETYPLPADRERNSELGRILKSGLEVPASSSLAAYAEFERLGPPGHQGPWAVSWSTVDRSLLGHVAREGDNLRSPDIDPNLYQRRYV